jgi:hypothetical protein
MPEIKKFSTMDRLIEADNDPNLVDSPSLLGMTMLTYPTYVNAMRGTMFTAHLKQYLNLKEPEFPYLFTSNENMVGKYSDGYKKANGSLKVVSKIVKYDDILEHPKIYKLFVFNNESNRYEVIERRPSESLTENFGYEYVNDVIDSFDVGDEITKDTILYKSTSYDEDMNYGYGRNALTLYTLDPFTSEDAAIASESFCEKMTSIETDEIEVLLNNNDYFINMYGDNKSYKPIPDIGEVVSDRLCAVRRLFNNQVLYDFKESSLSEIHEGDLIFFVDKNVQVIDITIYNNNEEIIDNPFNAQINKYLRSQNKYYRKIYNTCKKIINSGKEYSQDIDYLYKRSQEFLDTKKKWRSSDSEFNNLKIVISVKRDAKLSIGCKITGRYGNKSVISAIRPDDEMPYIKMPDGSIKRVELLLNMLAVINRTTPEAPTELFTNGCSRQVVEEMKRLKTFAEKENLLFDYIRTINEDEYNDLYNRYVKYTKKQKESVVQKTLNTDIIYINQMPIGEKKPIFYACRELLEKFKFLKEDDVYVKKFGREIKMLTKSWVGEMYVLKLKQSDRRGFSVRSTGAVDAKGLPTRSFKSKAHLEQKSSSCIRFKSLNHYTVMCS